MRITFEIPEIFVTFSFIFFLKGMHWPGAGIMAAGLFFSLCRFSLEHQKRKEDETRKIEMINQISDGITGVFSNFVSSSNKFH